MEQFNEAYEGVRKNLTEQEKIEVLELSEKAKDSKAKAIKILNEHWQIQLAERQKVDFVAVKSCQKPGKMTEKFELKTAAQLLPELSNKEETVFKLIDAIELYDEMLEDAGKKLLIKYVLKAKIPQNYKLRMKDTYADAKELVKDLRTYFITPKSVGALSVQLNTARQGGQSINEFGRKIEELFSSLTIAQAKGISLCEGLRGSTTVDRRLIQILNFKKINAK